MTETVDKIPEKSDELVEMFKFLGELWRDENTIELKNGATSIPKPYPAQVGKILLKYCQFAYIGRDTRTKENKQLYIYDAEKGLYTLSKPYIEQFVIAFDERTTSKKFIEEVALYIGVNTEVVKPFEDDKRIPVDNGVFNLETKELESFSPKFAITSKIQTAYNEKAKDKPNIKDFDIDEWMKSIACGDDEIVTLLWQIMNESINPNRTRKKIAILYGDGNNGKGTYQRLLENLIGAENISNLMPQDFADGFQVATLDGKVCNIGDDIGDKYLDNISALMSIATGDTITVNPKHKQPYEANYKLLCLFSGNALPKAKNRSNGWYRRLCIVPFNADFNGKAERPEIKEKFFSDNRLLEHVLYRILNMPNFDKFIEPKAVIKMVEEYKTENDYLYSFVTDFYIPNNYHELKHVPLFVLRPMVENYVHELGLHNPNLYGYTPKLTKHLEKQTGEQYTVAHGAMTDSDIKKMEEMDEDFLLKYEIANLKKSKKGLRKNNTLPRFTRI